ncbi:hypothetical protein AA637_12395 [Cyanobacterium sp. HL-69]|nr:hypothetical protein AA637_12395 [Cyanobacterium sp. HL-69]
MTFPKNKKVSVMVVYSQKTKLKVKEKTYFSQPSSNKA